jgi:D-alanine transaminase
MGEPLAICHLNGEYVPLREARISPLDRGFLYSDGCYDVTPIYGGRPFRFTQHHDRLTRSLKEIRLGIRCRARPGARSTASYPATAMPDACIYVQVTRGAEYGRSQRRYPMPRTVFAFWPPPGPRLTERLRTACPRSPRRDTLGALRRQVRLAAGERAAARAGHGRERLRGTAAA